MGEEEDAPCGLTGHPAPPPRPPPLAESAEQRQPVARRQPLAQHVVLARTDDH